MLIQSHLRTATVQETVIRLWFRAYSLPLGILIFALTFSSLVVGADAQPPAADPLSELLDMMTQKGMLTEQEAQKVRGAADALKAENARLKADAEKISAPPPRWKAFESVKNLEFYGDMRFRYEGREVTTPVNDKLSLDRGRYSLRLGARGDLFDDFYFGLKLETASNNRSPWLTFGTSSGGVPYYGPFGKSVAGVNLSQVYLGWRPTKWVDVTIGKMSNPLFTTPMLWDPDLNPEGAAERFKYTIGKADLFANLGQFLYQDVNPTRTSPFLVPTIPAGQNGNLPFLLAWQAGVNYHFTKDISFKTAFTLYNYSGHGANTVPGGLPAVPGFSDYYVGEGAGVPVAGASGYPTALNGGFAFNQTGINNLFVIDVPFEFNFKIAQLNARVFGDFAENLDGAARAAAAVNGGLTNNLAITLNLPYERNENKAYQIGFGIGNGSNLGLVTGSIAKKGMWEARIYGQHVEQYALDPNLLDSDFFEGRANMEGIYSAFAYSITDSIIGTVRYGYGRRINKNLGTGGSNLDIPQINPINDYHIFQVDLTWKF